MSSPETDAGTDAGPEAAGEPLPPEPPRLACPEGFVESPDRFGTACEPPAETVHLGACPDGEFADELPTDATVFYVRPGATSGSGTHEQPFGSIREAMVRAAPGAVIALARGVYSETVYVHAGVTVAGACAAETRIVPAATLEGAVQLVERDAVLRDVTVAPSSGSGILLLQDPTLERVVVDGADGFAIYAGRGTTAKLRHVIVRNSTDSRGSGLGRGLDAESGAEVTVQHARFEGNGAGAVHASDEGTVVTLEDVIARGNGHEALDARQLNVQDGARVELRRGLFEDNRGAGFVAIGLDVEVVLEDAVFRGFRTDLDGTSSGGGIVHEGARATLRRVRLEGPEGFGLGALGGSSLTIEDVVVRDTTRGRRETGVACGIAGSSLVARRLWIEGSGGAALMSQGPDTTVRLEDVTVARTGEVPASDIFGLAFGTGTSADIERVRVSRTTSAAILVTGVGAVLDASDVHVTDTRPRPDGTFGRAIEVQKGASATLSRARLAGNREVTALAVQGATLTLQDVYIEDALPRACAETTCADAPAGTGLGAYLDGRVTAQRFVIANASLCGVQIASGGSMRLEDGEIRRSAIGACIQVDGFDLEAITSDVAYADNGVNVDMTMHSVPSPTEALPVL